MAHASLGKSLVRGIPHDFTICLKAWRVHEKNNAGGIGCAGEDRLWLDYCLRWD